MLKYFLGQVIGFIKGIAFVINVVALAIGGFYTAIVMGGMDAETFDTTADKAVAKFVEKFKKH